MVEMQEQQRTLLEINRFFQVLHQSAVTFKLYISHISALYQPHLSLISATSHPYFRHIPATSQPHPSHITDTSNHMSQPQHSHISATSQPHPSHISATFQPHLTSQKHIASQERNFVLVLVAKQFYEALMSVFLSFCLSVFLCVSFFGEFGIQ